MKDDARIELKEERCRRIGVQNDVIQAVIVLILESKRDVFGAYGGNGK